MTSVRVGFLLLVSTLALAQSRPLSLVRQPLASDAPDRAAQPDPATQSRIADSYGKLPLCFEANQGQTDTSVKFLSRGSGYTLFLTSDEAVFSLYEASANTPPVRSQERRRPVVMSTNNTVLRMKFVDANPTAKVIGSEELAGKSNYFIGNDPKRWLTGVPTYAKVKYEGVYSGIDLLYHGNPQQLEYDFVVAPGADPRRIQLDVLGAKRISRGQNGDLVFHLRQGEVRWHKPVVYQEKGHTRQEIGVQYAIAGANRVGFEFAKYDARRPLYIDPLLYSTYLGGSGADNGSGIAVDSAGNAYVTGATSSANFPTQGPVQPMFAGGRSDAFVAKINATGSALIYSTYLGGGGDDSGSGIALDTEGNAYVSGWTTSTNFPTLNALQSAYGGGDYDAFVTQINASGSALVYSTYLGGSGIDLGSGIAVDSAGNAYVVGTTASSDFPTTPNAFQAACGDVSEFGCFFGDGFVAKINAAGSALIYSTYLAARERTKARASP